MTIKNIIPIKILILCSEACEKSQLESIKNMLFKNLEETGSHLKALINDAYKNFDLIIKREYEIILIIFHFSTNSKK
jgi:hypothetical protein